MKRERQALDMGKKEEAICIGIHHAATILGWLTALTGLLSARQKTGTKVLLGLFAAVQTLAVVKILRAFYRRKSSLTQTFHRIRTSGLTVWGQRALAWSAVGACTAVKLGIPALVAFLSPVSSAKSFE